MSKFTKWLKSKTGRITIGGVILVLIIVAVLGTVFGWWRPGGFTGTAGLPTPPPTPSGYTCLPTCIENDGKFIFMAGFPWIDFAGTKQAFWIAVPSSYTSLEIGFFDGDSGKDNAGAINQKQGNWDDNANETTYTLYADPLKDGTGTTVVGTWRGNTDNMPNNAWYNVSVNVSPDAQAPSGNFFYRLEATGPTAGSGSNAFKLRSTGFLSAGRSDILNTNYQIIGMMAPYPDQAIIYPGGTTDLGYTTYTGDWQINFYVPATTTTIDLWDGEFDRGTKASVDPDTDDANTVGKPAWAGSYAKDEGAKGAGSPPDDNSNAGWKRTPAVFYELIDPNGNIYLNNNPSGTDEFENFIVSNDSSINPDILTTNILGSGWYTIHIVGFDLKNTTWLHLNYEICDKDAGCGPSVQP